MKYLIKTILFALIVFCSFLGLYGQTNSLSVVNETSHTIVSFQFRNSGETAWRSPLSPITSLSPGRSHRFGAWADRALTRDFRATDTQGNEFIITNVFFGVPGAHTLEFTNRNMVSGRVDERPAERIEPPAPRTVPAGERAFDRAVKQAVEEAFDRVRLGSMIAIPEIEARPRRFRDTAQMLIESAICDEGFNIVERRDLERIMEEQMRGLSWEFDDATAANIGRLAGAQFITIIRIIGDEDTGTINIVVVNASTGVRMGTAVVRY